MAQQTTTPRAAYAEANMPRRGPRVSAATQQARAIFNTTAVAGGHAGTAASAGNYTRRQDAVKKIRVESYRRRPLLSELDGQGRQTPVGASAFEPSTLEGTRAGDAVHSRSRPFF